MVHAPKVVVQMPTNTLLCKYEYRDTNMQQDEKTYLKRLVIMYHINAERKPLIIAPELKRIKKDTKTFPSIPKVLIYFPRYLFDTQHAV